MTLILNTKHTSVAAFAASSRVRRSDRLDSIRGGGGADPVDIACSDKGFQLGGGQAMSQI